MGAIVGKKDIMDCALKTFISSVFWTEKIGPASALAFIKKHKKLKLGNKLTEIGKEIKKYGLVPQNTVGLKLKFQALILQALK